MMAKTKPVHKKRKTIKGTNKEVTSEDGEGAGSADSNSTVNSEDDEQPSSSKRNTRSSSTSSSRVNTSSNKAQRSTIVDKKKRKKQQKTNKNTTDPDQENDHANQHAAAAAAAATSTRINRVPITPIKDNEPQLKLNPLQKTVRTAFNLSQHVHHHNKALKQLKDAFDVKKADDFKKELFFMIRVALRGETKSPMVKHTIEFIVKFLVNVFKAQNLKDKENSNNQLDDAIFGDEDSELSLLDVILGEILVPCLSHEASNVRYNTCVLTKRIVMELEDIDENIYEQVKTALIKRIVDKTGPVRVVAVKALFRFQEEDPEGNTLLAAFKFHLRFDPDYEIRLAILECIGLSKYTLPDVIMKTRDIKDLIRKAAYLKLERVDPKHSLTIEQRLTIIRNGLNDRSAAVRKVVESKLLISWLKAYDNDLVLFLLALDIQSEPHTIEKALNSLFEQFKCQLVDDNRTNFDLLYEEFPKEYLDNQKLFTKKELSSERAFFWRFLAQFAKKHDKLVEQGSNTIDQFNDVPHMPLDLFEKITPDLPHLCTFIKKFITQIEKNTYEIEDLENFEFMFQQLMDLLLMYEIGDEAQLQKLKDMLNFIWEQETLDEKFHNYISLTMRCYSRMIFKNSNDLMNFTASLIDDIFNKRFQKQMEEREPTTITSQIRELEPVERRKLELQSAKLTVDIEYIKDELNEAQAEKNFAKCQELQTKIEIMVIEKQRLRNLIFYGSENVEVVQEVQQSQAPSQEEMPMFTEYPEEHLKSLEIFCGSLEFGYYKSIDSIIQTQIDKIVLPGVLNENSVIRRIAIKALGLCCFISSRHAKQYLILFNQIVNLPQEEDNIKMIALQAMFDFFCEHNFNKFIEDEPQKKTKKNESFKSFAEIEKSNNSNVSDKTLENESRENTIIHDKTLIQDDDEDEEGVDSEKKDDSYTLEEFVDQLKDVFLDQLSSKNKDIQIIAAQGIAKLMLLGKLYSSFLLCRLMVLWYLEDTHEQVQGFIGVFFPIFASSKTKNESNSSLHVDGQSLLRESFVETVENIYRAVVDSNERYENNDAMMELQYDYLKVDIKNMISFSVQLFDDDNHFDVAFNVLNKLMFLINLEETAEKIKEATEVIKHVFTSLTVLNFSDSTEVQLNQVLEAAKKTGQLIEVKLHIKQMKPCELFKIKVQKKIEKLMKDKIDRQTEITVNED